MMTRRVLQLSLAALLALVGAAGAPQQEYLGCRATSIVTPGQDADIECWASRNEGTVSVDVIAISTQDAVAITGGRKKLEDFAGWKSVVPPITLSYDGSYLHASTKLPAVGAYLIRARSNDRTAYGLTVVSTIGIVTVGAGSAIAYVPVDLRTFRVVHSVPSAFAVSENGTRALTREPDGAFVNDVTAPNESKETVYLVGDDGSITFADARSWWFHRAVPARRAIFVQTDRTLYRPGDVVDIRAIARTGTIGNFTIDRTPMHLELSGGSPSRSIARRTLTPSPFGTVDTSVRLPEDASLGEYQITVEREAAGSISVEAYKKPEYVIDVTPVQAYLISGESATFHVHAQYLFGAPATGMTIEAFSNVQQNGGYSWNPFGASARSGGDEYTSSKSTQLTDAQGNAIVRIPTKALGSSGRIEMTAEARDESGRTVSAQVDVPIYPASFALTIMPDQWIGRPGTPSTFRITSANHDGTPRARIPVDVNIVELSYKDRAAVETPRGHAEVTTDANGKASFAFAAPHAGSYRFEVRANDEAGRATDAYGYQWVVDPNSQWAPPTGHPTLVPAKALFSPSEDVHVTLALDQPNRDAIVTVSSDRLVLRRTVHVAAYTADIVIPKQRNVEHLHVQAYVPEKSGTAYASADVAIASDTMLQISARADKPRYLPGEPATVRLHAVDTRGRPVRAEIGLAVVDEGIFAMQNQALSPRDPFYGMIFATSGSANWRRPEHTLKMIAKVTSRSGGLLQAGSSADVYSVSAPKPAAADVSNVTLRSDFRDTAFWAPAVVTDANGNAVVHFRWPENLTTWRTTAVAVTRKTELGMSLSQSVVTKPLLVRLETPRFLRAGDRASLTGIVHAPHAGEAVRMQLDAPALGSAARTLTTAVGTTLRASGSWDVAAAGVGSANVALRAVGASGSDGMQTVLPLIGATAIEHARDAGIAHSAVTIPLALHPGELQGDLHLSLSPSVLAELVQTMREFDVYPYYCTEQTSSNAEVAVAVLRASKALPGITLPSDPKVVLARAVERLKQLRHSDGGWGWWENDASSVDMTAYALATLMHVQEVTGDKADDYMTYLASSFLRQKIEQGDVEPESMAYVAYAVALERGSIPGKAIRAMERAIDTARPYQAAMIGLAANASGDTALAERAVARLLATARSNGGTLAWSDGRWNWSWWSDPIEATAYAVELLEVRHHDREAEAGLAFLREHRSGDWWYTTKDTAAAVMALAHYESQTGSALPDETVRILVDGRLARTVHLTQLVPDASDSRVVLPASMLQGATAVTLDREGAGALYWSSDDVKYAARNAAQTRNASDGVLARLFAAPPALSVSRRYSTGHNGAWRVGDPVTVDLWITARDGAQYVTLEDPFPAGVEYQPMQGAYGSSIWWWSGMQFLDDRAAFFIYNLPPGETMHLTYRLRATTPGTFAAPGPSAFASYGPPVTTVGTGEEVVIR